MMGESKVEGMKTLPQDKAVTSDPVCGMRVDLATATRKLTHAGKSYAFCSDHCLRAFKADPGKYLQQGRASCGPPVPGARYTCPMHPEIVQQGPGSCPKCGMALEPKDASISVENQEY